MARSRRAGPIVCSMAAAVLLCARPSHAGQPGAPAAASERARILGQLWAEITSLLERASDAREPPLVPPTPVAVRWQPRRISSIALDAPLLALGSGDLDGDGKAELVVLTAADVLVVERGAHRKLEVRARAALPDEPAAIRPRDPVGTMVIADTNGDGRMEIAARSSEQARGALLSYRDGALREDARFAGFPLCPGAIGELEPGRNYFHEVRWIESATASASGPEIRPDGRPGGRPEIKPDSRPEIRPDGRPEIRPDSRPDSWPEIRPDAPARFHALRCRGGLVDAAGRPMAVAGAVGTDGALLLRAERRCRRRDDACRRAAVATQTVAGVGVAFEIADVNRDGDPEIMVTAAAPPGDPDRVTVLSWQGAELRRAFERTFNGGVVGLTASDLDGDGVLDVVAAVRLWGSNRVDLWTFN